MFIEDNDFQALVPHLSTEAWSGGMGTSVQAPRPMFALITSLTSPDRVVAGHSDYIEGDSSTTWRTWILTEMSIGFAQVDFGIAMHTAENESRLGQHNQAQPPHGVPTAWLRPFSDVSELKVGSVSNVTLEGWFVASVRIRFRDDPEEFVLPGQSNLHGDHQRMKSDVFYRELRDRLFGLVG